MNQNLLFENNYTYYCLLICTGIVLGCCYHYYIKTNNTAIPSQNTQNIQNIQNTQNNVLLTNEEIEAIVNENAVTVGNSDNMSSIIDSDSDSDTDVNSDYQSSYDSDNESYFENILNEEDVFFINVDFNVCPIEELKFFEFKSFFAREIVEHSISDAEIMEFISWYSEAELCTNWINDQFLSIISIL